MGPDATEKHDGGNQGHEPGRCCQSWKAATTITGYVNARFTTANGLVNIAKPCRLAGIALFSRAGRPGSTDESVAAMARFYLSGRLTADESYEDSQANEDGGVNPDPDDRLGQSEDAQGE